RDVLYTASGDIAHQLHVANLENAVYRTTTQEDAVLACTTTKPGDVWTADCSRRAEPELTEVEVAVRVAAHLYLMSRQDHPIYEENSVCIGESVGRFGA